MKLSVPIFRLKRQAKLLSKQRGLPLHDALDRIARDEGFQRWSQLAACHADAAPARTVLDRLNDGDLVLLGACREHGKTTLAFEMMAEAVKQGRKSAYFTLCESDQDIRNRLSAVGMPSEDAEGLFLYDTSDEICASYIVEKVGNAPAGMFIVIDYLQILDQQRHKPPLAEQIAALKDFADTTGAVVVLISQIDRAFDPGATTMPDIDDVHLPNPADLALFTKACFLNDGELRLRQAA